jgi:hypothetical protein
VSLRNKSYRSDPPVPAVATFDERNHCDREGWATWQKDPMFRFRLRCAFGRHAWPLRTPIPANGHSPSNYDRCTRCHAFVLWFVDGQHRYGSLNRYFADLEVR